MFQPDQERELTAEKISSSESLRLFLVQLSSWLITVLSQIELTEQTLENLEKLDEQLKESSVVVYGYHATVFDAVILPILLSSHLDNVDKMLAPITITHYQGLNRIFLALISFLTNTEFLPVIRKKDEANYSGELKRQLLKQLIETTRKHLSLPRSIYGVAPMSTRTKVLQSDSVNPGFAKVAQKHQVPLMPIAFSKDERNKLTMSVGEIMPYPDLNNIDQAVQTYMNSLAQMIPKKFRGDYK
jgi:1-acyl-sn-glycerol-3-phosphate acyltransferase